MSLNSMGFGFMFTATDLASGVMQNIRKNFQGLEENAGKSFGNIDQMVQRLGVGLMTGFASAGALAGTFKLAQAASAVEKNLASVKVVTHGTAKEMAALKAYALDGAKSLGVMPEKAIEGMEQLGQQGYAAEDIIKVLPDILKFSAAGAVEVGTAADIANQAMQAFQITTEHMPDALNQMVKAADMFSMNVGDLQIGLARASGGAFDFKATLTDTLQMFGLIKNVLHSTELSGTSVSVIFSRMANPRYRRFLEGKGIQFIDPNTQKYRKPLEVITDIMKLLDTMSEPDQGALIMKTFGQQGEKGVAALLAQFQKGIKDTNGVVHKGAAAMAMNLAEIAKKEDTLGRASAIRLDTFDGSMNKMKASFSALKDKFGEPFAEAWRPWVDDLTKGLDDISTKFDLMPAKLKKITAEFAMLASVVGLVVGGMSIFGAAGPMLTAGFKASLGAIADMLVGIGSFLFSWVGAILIGFVGIGVAISKNLGGVGDAWNRLMGYLFMSTDVFETIGKYGRALWDEFKAGWDQAWEDMKPGFRVLGEAFDRIMVALVEMGVQMGDMSKPGDTMKWLFKGIGYWIGKAVTWVASFIGGIIYLGSWIAWLVAKVVKAFTWITDKFGSLLEWIGMYKKQAHDVSADLGDIGLPTPGPRPDEAEARKAVEPPVEVKTWMDMFKDKPKSSEPAAVDSQDPNSMQRKAGNPFEGLQQTGDAMNYDKMGEALTSGIKKARIGVYVDGQSLIGWLDAAERDREYRGHWKE